MSGGFAEDMRQKVIENEKRLKDRKHLIDIDKRYSGNSRKSYPDKTDYPPGKLAAFREKIGNQKNKDRKGLYRSLIIVIITVLLVGYILLFRIKF